MDVLKLLIDLAEQGKWAVLFFLLYLGTTWYFFKELKARNAELKEAKDEAKSTTERVVTAMEKASHATEEQVTLMRELKTSIDDTRIQSRELMAFLQGRDAGGRP